MVSEVTAYGQIQSLGRIEDNPARASLVNKPENANRISLIKGRASLSLDRSSQSVTRNSTNGGVIPDTFSASYADRDSGLVRRRASTIREQIELRDEEELTADERDFRDALMRRVLLREQAEREQGLPEDVIQADRKRKENEVARCKTHSRQFE